MTIEIQRPELEALIRERMKVGGFDSVEDALIQALLESPVPSEVAADLARQTLPVSGADLVAAMQASPYKEISLESTSGRPPVRDVAF